jgi:phage-related minor tail protein
VTGNAAGVTAGQVDSMSRSLALSANVGIGKARTALEELIKTGQVGPQSLGAMSTAIVRLEALTGETAEVLVKDFAKMGEGVAKWAEEHNKQYNFISGDQYAYIKRLEEQGQKETAEAEVLRLLNDHLKDLHPNLGTLESAWKSLGEAASSAWDKMKGLGRAETVEDRIAQTQAAIDEIDRKQRARHGLAAFSSAPEGQGNETRAGLVDQQQQNFRDQLRQSELVLSKAEEDRQHKAQIAAIDARDRWREETKGISLVNKELEKYRTLTVAPLKGTANEISAQEQAATEAAIRKRYESRDTRKLESAFKGELETLTAEGLRLDAETKSWDLYGKAIDKGRVAILQLKIDQGKLAGITPAQQAQLLAIAKSDDQKEKLLAETEARVKATAAADKFVAKLTDEANAHATNARAQDLANRIAELDRIGVQKGTAAYGLYVDAIEKAVDAKHDQILANKLAAQQLAADDEVAKIREQIDALHMSTLERQDAVIALKAQKQAEKDILADPSGAEAIRAAAIKQTEQLVAANDDLYFAQRRASTGAAQFLQKYQEDATNAAKFTEQALSGGIGKVEDALVKFTETGKIRLGSLWTFMYEEFLRNWIKIQIAQQATSGSTLSKIIGVVGSFAGFSGGSSGLSTADYSTSGFATGTNPNYSNEGRSTPSSVIPAVSKQGNVQINIANHGQPFQAVAQDIRAGGAVHSAMAQQYGLSRANGAPQRA